MNGSKHVVAFVAGMLFLLGGATGVFAATPTQDEVSLSIIRAVRISDSSITLSFKTNKPAIGIVRYTDSDGTDVTLTDSAAEANHLFTLTDLNPSRGYTFVLIAETDTAKSNTYTILLSPETVGPPGASILPGFQILDAKGVVIAATLTASSTTTDADGVPTWAYVAGILIVALGYGIYGIYTYRTRHQE